LSRTQSVTATAATRSLAGWRNSLRRRAQTRRKPITSVDAVSSAPYTTASTISSSTLRTSQVSPREPYQSRPKPALSE
jgi:hypothetical protein